MKYERFARYLRPHAAALRALDRALVVLVAGAFVVCVVALLLVSDVRVVRMLVVCAVGFMLCTALRAILNWSRPYEGMDPIVPVVPKATCGKSFPSRHVTSATLIASAFVWLAASAGPGQVGADVSAPAVAVVSYAVVAVIACVRVACGNHFPRDVVAAICLGAAVSAVGFLAFP